MSSARPHFSSTAPISVKKGMASSRSLERMPNMLIGRLAMNTGGNQPISMAKKPQNRPSAASENATGKPISMITISPVNMTGAKFSICIFVGSCSCSYCTGFS